MEKRLWRKMHKVRPQLLKTGPLSHPDDTRLHIGNVVTEKLLVYGWELLPHPLYSPNISPSDFDLFPKLKKPMRGGLFPLLKSYSVPEPFDR